MADGCFFLVRRGETNSIKAKTCTLTCPVMQVDNMPYIIENKECL